MDRQLRPRRQGIPADHNYFAPYPNTIYTFPLSSTTEMSEQKGNSKTMDMQPPSKKKRKPSATRGTQPTTFDTSKSKKRWRYFGYRRKQRETKPYSEAASGSKSNDGHKQDVDQEKRKSKIKKKKFVIIRDPAQIPFDRPELKEGQMVGLQRCSCCNRWRISRKERRRSQRLVIKNFKLPFDRLPDLCKLKIFSFLSESERGKVAQVCQEWRRLMRHPGLWSHINFSAFNPAYCSGPSPRGTGVSQFPWFMTVTDYNKYCLRLQKYFLFLEDITPHLNSLRFEFDIVNLKDDWLKHLSSFVQHANCKKLQTVDMNWTHTPVRPPCADRYCCFFNKARMALQKHIKRVIVFHRFLNELTKAAPMVKSASLPFDWSERSVLLLCRWCDMEILRLNSYIQLRLMLQELVDLLLDKLKRLQKLHINVCSPLVDTAENKNFYSISHPRLKELDVAGCSGIFLRSLNTPGLEVLKTPESPWRELGGSTRRRFYPPCLYVVLKQGAPKLMWFNNHRLLDYWLEYPYEELERVLKRTCPCKTHSRRLQAEQNAEDQQH